ncbi:hypothetical protein Mapa_016098 [Marchantia paleacea]|nr:hypothetical protein Mapa_016098 [Marchantia paleacea]
MMTQALRVLAIRSVGPQDLVARRLRATRTPKSRGGVLRDGSAPHAAPDGARESSPYLPPSGTEDLESSRYLGPDRKGAGGQVRRPDSGHRLSRKWKEQKQGRAQRTRALVPCWN